jgi:hypothetical protein
MEGGGLAVNGIQLAVHSLASSFVQRQKLALAALGEIRPDLLDRPGEKRVRPTKEYIKLTQSGYWGEDKEWRYFIHGRGCRLVHTATKEPIEWDAPNVRRFDPYWFVNWLNWLRTQEDKSEAIRIIETHCKEHSEDVKTLVFNVLDQLQQAGVLLLHPDRTNRYELT